MPRNQFGVDLWLPRIGVRISRVRKLAYQYGQLMAATTTSHFEKSHVSRSWLVKSFRWLIPSRFDWVVVLCCSLIAIGFIDPFLDQQLFRYFSGREIGHGKLGLSLGFSAASLTAVAVALGWRKLEIKSGLMIVGSCLVALLGFAWSSMEVIKTWVVGVDLYQQNSPIDEMLFSQQSWLEFCGKTIALSAIGLIAIFCLTRGIVYAVERMRFSNLSRIKLSRTKLMIGLALALLGVKVVQDFCFPMGYMYSFKVFGSAGWWGELESDWLHCLFQVGC